MKEHFIEYLANEKLFSLSASLIGLSSILVSIYLLLFQPQVKSFALTMLIIGLLEAGVFSASYFTANKRASERLNVFETNPKEQIEFQNLRTQKILTAFFLLKVLYATIFAAAVVVLSKFNVPPFAAGILIALMLHAGLAATIDSFGELHTKKYLKQLNST